jgi:hypothetical protein
MSYSLAQYPLAPHFWSQSRAKRNILITSQHDLRRLARTAGQTTSEGFKYDSKANPAFWPYPCPRPTFRTAWLYRTASMATLHSVAMQLRVLWMCLKWDDMNTKPPNPDGKNQVPVISSFSLQWRFLNQAYHLELPIRYLPLVREGIHRYHPPPLNEKSAVRLKPSVHVPVLSVLFLTRTNVTFFKQVFFD